MTTYSGHPDQAWGSASYAQHGDDLMIMNLFRLAGLNACLTGAMAPTWLDLGAHHPTTVSNTRKLYERGARGVNIEANPNLMDAFRLERPLDVNVNIGVGVKAGAATFYMYSDTSGRNTFAHAETVAMRGTLDVKREINLAVQTIDEIVDEHCKGRFPPLLLSDIEGLDYEVLASADFETKGKPFFIVVETRRDETARMRAMLTARGFACYCRMGENLFFVRKELIDRMY